MRLPRTFSWCVNDNNGNSLIRIDGLTNADFQYGMAGAMQEAINTKVHSKGVQLKVLVILNI